MATGTEIREFALQNNCSDAIALKILSLRAENARLTGLLDRIVRSIDFERGAADGVDHGALLIETNEAIK